MRPTEPSKYAVHGSSFRRIWALGQSGVDVPLLINREGKTFDLRVKSSDRRRFLKGPVLH